MADCTHRLHLARVEVEAVFVAPVDADQATLDMLARDAIEGEMREDDGSIKGEYGGVMTYIPGGEVDELPWRPARRRSTSRRCTKCEGCVTQSRRARPSTRGSTK